MNLETSFHSLSIEEAYKAVESSEEGLSSDEASDRLQRFGKNLMAEKRKRSILSLILSQVKNPVIYLLVVAATVSFIFGDIPEGIAIIIVILLNTIIGFWMEYRAQTSIEALKKMDKLTAQVSRNGEVVQMDAEGLVPGDVIHLEPGDLIPADARITYESELTIDEAPLTGESVPVEKQAGKLEEDIGVTDRINMVYKGTAVTNGKARALVTGTGMQTEIGEISRMVSEAEGDDIPLNKKLSRLARRLIYIIAGLSVLFFIFGWIAGKEIYLLLQTAIAWTVAAIPEGLPIVASISLARGMLRLSRQNVLVRKLSAVETLGETTLIMTDKTGTLTRNQLTLDELELTDREKENEAYRHFFNVAVLCNDASPDDGGFKGDPLDAALLEYGSEKQKDRFDELRNLHQINEDPFDSDSMFMGAIHRMDDQCYISAKGAVSIMLEKSSHYLGPEGKEPMDDNAREHWQGLDRELSSRGLKVIGFAYREEPGEAGEELSGKEEFVEEMIFLGAAGFIDPVRDDIKEPLELCHQAGIKIVMVTGDHPETSLNIAGKIGLVKNGGDQVVHGKDLDKLEDVSNKVVFARVDPSQKLELVQMFKKQGEIVGMTGDGVNDAPALKAANIGIAMGKRGTQVARDVSDMVLLDDAFPSIVRAVEQGRTIFGNIKKFIIYQLSYHLSEIIIIAAISFTIFQLPLLPLQLLFLNLLSDVFPALALGVGKGHKTVMQHPPKDPDEPILTRRDWKITGIYGIVIAVYVIGAYLYAFYGLGLSEEICNNIAFFGLAFGQLLHVFNMREADEPLFNNQVTRNKYIWMALGFCIAALVTAYYIPVLKDVLSIQDLQPVSWGLVAGAGILPLLTNQLLKGIWKL